MELQGCQGLDEQYVSLTLLSRLLIPLVGPFNRVFPSSPTSPSSPLGRESTAGPHVGLVVPGEDGMETDRGASTDDGGLVGKVVGKGWMRDLDG